jgi:hypothetical protein
VKIVLPDGREIPVSGLAALLARIALDNRKAGAAVTTPAQSPERGKSKAR